MKYKAWGIITNEENYPRPGYISESKKALKENLKLIRKYHSGEKFKIVELEIEIK